MFISYAILTHNEGRYITTLLRNLVGFISWNPEQIEQEIVILDDYSTDPTTQMALRHFSEQYPFIKVSYRKHDGNFADQKNALNRLCGGKWIFNLDADELAEDTLLQIIPLVIRANYDVDVYRLPRVNTVEGLTLGKRYTSTS